MNTLESLYLDVHSLFQRIPAYSDNDRKSMYIREHSRHRSGKDHFHMETKIIKQREHSVIITTFQDLYR